jgi:hypothetical protein
MKLIDKSFNIDAYLLNVVIEEFVYISQTFEKLTVYIVD